MALPEKTLVWCAIRDSVTDMHRFKYIFFVNLRFSSRAGVNSIAVLLWSQGRSLEEVTRTSLGSAITYFPIIFLWAWTTFFRFILTLIKVRCKSGWWRFAICLTSGGFGAGAGTRTGGRGLRRFVSTALWAENHVNISVDGHYYIESETKEILNQLWTLFTNFGKCKTCNFSLGGSCCGPGG